jgi:hypothetical protein
VRIRSLKPGFFKNETLCELSPWHRLCYEGLWCCADRDGRLEDRPKRLKAEIFPYDDVDMDALLWDLMRGEFIVRYLADSQLLIWILSWASHQFPRTDEAASKLPAFVAGSERTNGAHVSTVQVFRPIDTDPSLVRDVEVSTKQIGSWVLDLGSGVLEHGTSAADAASPSSARSCRAQDLVDLWNATTKPPIARCRNLTDDRQRRIRARTLRRPDLNEWRQAFEFVQADSFYTGSGSRGWVVDIDWFLKNDTNVSKVLERAQSVHQAAKSYEWVCPHTPVCLGRNACGVRSALEQGRVKAS